MGVRYKDYTQNLKINVLTSLNIQMALLIIRQAQYINICFLIPKVFIGKTCLQTLLLLFKCDNHRNKRPFVLTTIEALVGTLMTIGDVNDIFPIRKFMKVNKFVLLLPFVLIDFSLDHVKTGKNLIEIFPKTFDQFAVRVTNHSKMHG